MINLSQAGKVTKNLPGLLLEAERIAHSLMRGVHGRRRVGMGESFWQFRPYTPGDTQRDIDWRQTARRDEPFVRQMEWEAAQTVWLYRDASASMEFKSKKAPFSKKEYAELLLLSMGMLLLDGGEQVGLLGTELTPQVGYSSIERFCDVLPSQTRLIDNNIAARSHIFIMSDFYFPIEDILSFCESLAARNIKGILLQVFDEEEKDLPYKGRIKFEDIEATSGDTLDIPQVEAIRDLYKQKFIDHQKNLENLSKNIGWAFKSISTEKPPKEVVTELYNDLSVKG